jgi:phage gp46-like protein
MPFDRFQGDPAIKLTELGASMTFIGGQPVMDQGIENAVIISFFTKPGWWGNSLQSDPNKQIGSEVEKQRTIVDIDTINEYNDAMNNALNWMLETRLSSKNEIIVTNPTFDRINSNVKISPPGQDIHELLFIKNGLNWIAQAKYPAHGRY